MRTILFRDQSFIIQTAILYLHGFDARFSLDNSGVSVLPVMQYGLFVLVDNVRRGQRLWRRQEVIIVVQKLLPVRRYLEVVVWVGRRQQDVAGVVALGRHALTLKVESEQTIFVLMLPLK
jgi:hypothetical protein